MQAFELNLEEHIFRLHEDLKDGTYRHGPYESFYVCDPKRRHIHKPVVRDRLVHHAVFRMIEPLFEKRFIFDVWSCRNEKGTHKAIDRFREFAWKLSRNDTRTVWILKLDIKKFFESVDQDILIGLLSKRISDQRTMRLMIEIVRSFPRGIPLGNLTSQLFANIYLDVLDQFIKRQLKLRHHVRYCDDFVILHEDRNYLASLIPSMGRFLADRLALTLHPEKIMIVRYHGGVDFLGCVSFPHHRLLRTKTKRRMLRRISQDNRTSYFGMLGHVRGNKLRIMLRERLVARAPKMFLTPDTKAGH